MIESCSEEEYKQDEIKFQNSEEYPENFNDLVDLLYNSDTVVNVIEI